MEGSPGGQRLTRAPRGYAETEAEECLRCRSQEREREQKERERGTMALNLHSAALLGSVCGSSQLTARRTETGARLAPRRGAELGVIAFPAQQSHCEALNLWTARFPA